MSEFIQLHLLTSYPPANLNRDDIGRPKTAKMGGFDRLRVSSQSLKRAWRTSSLFEEALCGHVGVRTKRLGVEVYQDFLKKGVEESKAKEWAKNIAKQFGKLKKPKKKKKDQEEKSDSIKNPFEEFEIEQLVHISPLEREAVQNLTEVLVAEDRAPNDEELAFLQENNGAVDIALFGRMLTESPAHNTEAAVQVAHAITVHDVTVEDDYFTAVDDLKKTNKKEDAGSSHIGQLGFAAGLFYLYLCINKDQLIENLGGNLELANQALQALVNTAIKVAPSGKQNSFASRAYASYVLAERGNQQPRSLSVAFLNPVRGGNLLKDSISSLKEQFENMDQVYGACAEGRCVLNVDNGEGSLDELLEFITQNNLQENDQ